MVTPRLAATGMLALLTAVASRTHAEPRPRDPSWLDSRWGDFHSEALGLFIEGAAGPVAGVQLGSGELSLGYAARLGVRGRGPHMDSSGFTAIVPELLFGEIWSLDASFRSFRGAAGSSRLFVGLSSTSLNLIGQRTEDSRLRGPTLLGIALPEVGFWFTPGDFAAPYLSYSAPFSYLVSEHVALELRPSLTIAFHHDHTPNELHTWLSAVVLWR